MSKLNQTKMWYELFTEKDLNSSKGKLIKQKNQIIQALLLDEKATIPDLAQTVGQSVPTTTKFINELNKQKVVLECGKLDTKSGRSPYLYCLNANSGYIIAIEILLKTIRIGVLNLRSEFIHLYEDKEFRLKNTTNCLEEVLDTVEKEVKKANLPDNKIIGIGVGITGRVDKNSGHTFSFFNFEGKNLSQRISDRFKHPCFIDNDTRTIALGEAAKGTFDINNETLYLNISRGLGLAIFTNGKLWKGKSGFAGEFGHVVVMPKGKLCICGKRGCLGTEVSGYALEEKFVEKMQEGEPSLLNDKYMADKSKDKDIHYLEIIEAAKNGDMLSMELLMEMGETLGEQIGKLANIINPESIIIGGRMAEGGQFMMSSLKNALKIYALPLIAKDCKIEFHKVDERSGLMGAGSLVLNRVIFN